MSFFYIKCQKSVKFYTKLDALTLAWGMGHGDWKSKVSIYSFCDTTHKIYLLCTNYRRSVGEHLSFAFTVRASPLAYCCTIRERGRSHYNKKNAFYKTEMLPIRWIIDRAGVIDTIIGFANAFDAKDWQKVRSHLADEIDIDYSEFRGETPRRVTAEEYIKQRVEGLAGLRTLHVSTNHEVTLNNNTAECKSAYQIYRLDPTRESQNRFDTAGNYFHSLIQTDGLWLITGIKQTVVIVSGNTQVHGALRDTSQ